MPDRAREREVYPNAVVVLGEHVALRSDHAPTFPVDRAAVRAVTSPHKHHVADASHPTRSLPLPAVPARLVRALVRSTGGSLDPVVSNAPACSWIGLEELRSDVRAALSRRSCRRVELDDVVQEALMRAARYRGSLCDPGRLRAWVIRIALNVMRDAVRRDQRLPRIEKPDEVLELVAGREDIPGDPPEDDSVEAEGELFERHVLIQHMDRALMDLPRVDQRVLGAWYAEHDPDRPALHVREVADDMDKVRVFRARARLTRLLRKRLALDAPVDVSVPIAPVAKKKRVRRGARCATVHPKTQKRGQNLTARNEA